MRRKAWGECHRTANRNRLAYPSLLMPPVTAPPRRRRPCARPPKTSPYMRQQFLSIGLCRIVERDRAVGLAADDDFSFGHEVEIIDDLERLVDVVRHDDRRDAQSVVQFANQLTDDSQRD